VKLKEPNFLLGHRFLVAYLLFGLFFDSASDYYLSIDSGTEKLQLFLIDHAEPALGCIIVPVEQCCLDAAACLYLYYGTSLDREISVMCS
jgi:hypothetical protein